MSSGNITNKNIFSSLDSISTSLDLLSDRLENLERICLAGKDSTHPKTANSLNLLPGFIERITSAGNFDGVIEELLETMSLTMDRNLILILEDGKYIPLKSRGYDPQPENASVPVVEEEGLLSNSVNSRQILIFKGNIADQVSFASGEGNRIGYGMFIPIVFGEQVPMVYFGESANPPDPDLAESLVNIAALVIKNQHLAAMLKTGEAVTVTAKTETDNRASGSQYDDEVPEEQYGYPDIPVEVEDEEMSGLTDMGSKPVSHLSGDLKKIFRSVDDFDTDVISAEELIRSFNIDINKSIPDLEMETEDFLESRKQRVPDEEEPEVESEEDLEAWTGSNQLEIELPDDEDGESAEQESEPDNEDAVEISDIPEETSSEEAEEEDITADESSALADLHTLDAAETERPEEYEEALSFARLLISEIKLYNKEAVDEGRRKGDLYSRLKEQIDLSREVYEARVPDEVRAEKDFFGEELVRILAKGNTTLLDT